MKTAIIADWHHRIPWVRSIIAAEKPDKVIFTGDGLDYRNNKPTHGAAASYREVIDFLKEISENPDWLYIGGNHCLQYLQRCLSGGYGRSLCCGYDMECVDIFEEENEKDPLFLEKIFPKLAHIEEIGGQKVLLTHAGLHEKHMEKEGIHTIEECEERINRRYDNAFQNGFFEPAPIIGNIGAARNGWGIGGCLWRDNFEEEIGSTKFGWSGTKEALMERMPKFHQVFGHTASENELVIKTVGGFKNICLDGRQTIAAVIQDGKFLVRSYQENGDRMNFNVDIDGEYLKDVSEYEIQL